jgi:hypothetical protein
VTKGAGGESSATRDPEAQRKTHTEVAESAEVAEEEGRRGRKADPSTARPDAPNYGAEEKVGPLRSG